MSETPTKEAPDLYRSWHKLTTLRHWRGEEAFDIEETELPPPWRMFVLGDGSPTRHLWLLSGSKTAVDVLDMSVLEAADLNAPKEVDRIASPLLRRQVFLRNERGERLAYACSWWNETLCSKHLEDASLPIWQSLSTKKTEIFREIIEAYVGHSEALEVAFGCKGPFWGRYYLFWHNGAPLTLIYEVFSPLLEKYLGKLS